MSLVVNIVGRLPERWLKATARQQWRHPLLKQAFDLAVARLRPREITVQHGVGRGLRFSTGDSNLGYALGTSEPAVQEALAALIRPGMTVYDVGANVGFHAMVMARLAGPKGHVVCFEPVEANAALIAHNARQNGFAHVMLRREALGATDGEATFLTSSEPTFGRLAELGAPEKASGQITVPIRAADSLVPPLPVPDLIKIDVEGAEADVLRGARRLLAEHGPTLLIELHGTNAAIARALDENGYRGVVLGSDEPVAGARWDAHVIAVPRARTDLFPSLERLTRA